MDEVWREIIGSASFALLALGILLKVMRMPPRPVDMVLHCPNCHAQQEAEPPICADSGTPKWPGNCWNVRCQLGGTCCRAHGVKGLDDGR